MPGGGLSMSKIVNKIKIFISYIICMLVPSESANAVNEAADPSELDELMLRKAGFNDRTKIS